MSWSAPLWFDRLAGIAWRVVAIVVASAVAILLVVALGSVVLPTVLALLVATVLAPLSARLRARGLNRTLAAGAAVLVLLGVVVLTAWLGVRAVVDQWPQIWAHVEDGILRLQAEARDHLGLSEATSEQAADDLRAASASIADVVLGASARLLPILASAVGTVGLTAVVTFFFVRDGEDLWRGALGILDSGPGGLVDRIGQRVWTTLHGFVWGQTMIAAIDATGIGLGALVLGVPNVGAITLLTFVASYIPFVGAFTAGLLAVLLALGAGGTSTGIAMLVVVLVVQQIEGNFLQPMIQGRTVRVHPLVIALALVAGGALAGLLGVFLAVPVVASAIAAAGELRRAGILPAPTIRLPLDRAGDATATRSTSPTPPPAGR